MHDLFFHGIDYWTGSINRCKIFDVKIFDVLSNGLLDDFKGHSTDVVKNYVKSFKSGDDTNDDEDRYDLIDFHIMGGGITPKSQP